MKIKSITRFVLPILIAFGASACEDDAISNARYRLVPINDTPDPGQQSDPTDPRPGENTGDNTEDPVPETGWNAILVSETAGNIEIPYGGTVQVKVRLVSTDKETFGEGISGEQIRWTVDSGEDIGAISRQRSVTLEDGSTIITIASLNKPGTVTVRATSARAPKFVKFNVTVLDLPKGNLRVDALYNGPAPAKNFSIRLFDYNEVKCAETDLKTGVDVEPIMPAVDARTALFSDLSPEQAYTAIAYAYAENGAPVATGCIDSSILIVPDITTSASIALQTIDLDPVTKYGVRSYFDLGDVTAALGSVGKFIAEVSDFADNPAGYAYDKIMDAIVAGVGFWGSLAKAILQVSGIEKKLIEYLNGLVQESATACKVGLFACQMRNFIRMMEFMGDMSIEKAGSVTLKGDMNYDGVSVYWRVKCPADGDPNCGRLPLSMKQIGLDKDIYFLQGSWNGALANAYDRLSIETFEMRMKYGEIVVYLINNVLLPKVAGGATDFEDALAYWINADALAKWISKTLTITVAGVGIKVSVEQARGWVDSAISGLGKLLNFAAAFASLKTAGADILISGTADFKDTNADNKIDIIDGGSWNGNMSVKTTDNGTDVTVTTAVRGLWSAYNAENIVEGDGTDGKMYCTYPKTSTDSADQKCSYPRIDYSKLVGSGMCSKYAACSNL